jgi:hypothetical protein
MVCKNIQGHKEHQYHFVKILPQNRVHNKVHSNIGNIDYHLELQKIHDDCEVRHHQLWGFYMLWWFGAFDLQHNMGRKM